MVAEMRTCTVPNCDRKHLSGGYCELHYRRMRRHGTTDNMRRENGTGWMDSRGYINFKIDGISKGEHVLIVEKVLGKKLPEEAEVHHVDGNKSNNDPKNLVVCPDSAYHKLLHQRQRALDACGHADWLKCQRCLQYDDPKNMYLFPRKNWGKHRECENKYHR